MGFFTLSLRRLNPIAKPPRGMWSWNALCIRVQMSRGGSGELPLPPAEWLAWHDTNTQSDWPELTQSDVDLSHPRVHSHHSVYFVFTMLFTCYMQSVIVIMLITIVFFLQNARPRLKRVSVGRGGFERLSLRKTSCGLSRLFLWRLNSAV